MQDTGAITRCSFHLPAGTGAEPQPGAQGTGIFSTVACGEWSNSSTGLRNLTGKSVAGMENDWLCKPSRSFGNSSLCVHTQTFSQLLTLSPLSSLIKFN